MHQAIKLNLQLFAKNIMKMICMMMLLSSTYTFASNNTILSSCQSNCGGVEIPYPFGIGPDCALDGTFEVICNKSKKGEDDKPYLKIDSEYYELLSISPGLSRAQINMPVSWQCYEGEDNPTKLVVIDLTSTRFLLSSTLNKFTGIGCGFIPQVITSDHGVGCLPICPNRANNLVNGTCGEACCQVALPDYVIYAATIFAPNVNQSVSPCVYSAIVENGAFHFTSSYITSNMLKAQYMPAVINWGIPEENVASCSYNSNFSISTNSSYFCKCHAGFEGNPYLQNGCQDINECKDNKSCSTHRKCHNTIGSYYCSCPLGMRPDTHSPKASCQLNPASFTGLVTTAGVSVGIVLYLLFRVIFVYKKRYEMKQICKKREKNSTRHYQIISQLHNSSNQGITNNRLTVIGIEELEKATNQFGETSIVGKGGHGVVYKGMLSDQRIVAVKKPKINDDKETEEFLNEVLILSQLNHRNVVKLVGCCLESEVPLLVYEFISNGTLTSHLHVEEANQSLSWNDRLRIAIEIARALSYLHSAASISVFHRDIKTSNILLTDGLTTKLSDFGASRSIEIDQTGVTTIVQGTFGYLDPEYFFSGRLTEKSDVYSFGVILVELLTRKKPYSFADMQNGESLVSHFISIMNESRLPEIIDPQLLEEEHVAELETVAQIAQMCLKMKGEERPTMKEVEMRLEFLWSSKLRIAHHLNTQIVEQQRGLLENEHTEKEEGTSRAYSLEAEFILSSQFTR